MVVTIVLRNRWRLLNAWARDWNDHYPPILLTVTLVLTALRGLVFLLDFLP